MGVYPFHFGDGGDKPSGKRDRDLACRRLLKPVSSRLSGTERYEHCPGILKVSRSESITLPAILRLAS
jgi:hypothetical protein